MSAALKEGELSSCPPSRHVFSAVLLLAPTAASGSDLQSVLSSAGEQAAKIESLFWLYYWILAGVYVLVLIALAWGILRKRRQRVLEHAQSGGAPQVHMPQASLRRTTHVVIAALAATVGLLFVFLLSDFFTGRKLHALSQEPNPLKVKVVAQQWWWEFWYEDPLTSQTVITANELHLPVGRPVQLHLDSKDVIHSFWIPNISGKRDIIPGHATSFWIKADKPGEFRGQCAEFCGHQHAHMRFVVYAEPPEKVEAWLAAQRQPAREPVTDSQKHGRDVFLRSSCVMCHTISGTPARATVGPNLTHIASRPMLAAATLPNNRGNLAGWILDPQHVKPGVRMPQNNFRSEDLHALLDYLENLK